MKTKKKLTVYWVFCQRKYYKFLFKKKEWREKLNQHSEMSETRRARTIFLRKGELFVDAEGYCLESTGRGY